MREIILTKGAVALVDDADFALVDCFKWYLHSQGYAARDIGSRARGGRATILMHRFIVGPLLSQQIDHRDLNRLNNQRANLRIATQSQNSANREQCAGRRYKGVVIRRGHRSVYAEIAGHYLGAFDTMIDAARAYDRAAVQMFGEFARLNFPVIGKEAALLAQSA